jgi:hypothetical protein
VYAFLLPVLTALERSDGCWVQAPAGGRRQLQIERLVLYSSSFVFAQRHLEELVLVLILLGLKFGWFDQGKCGQ